MDEEFTEIFDILQNLKETMSTLNKKNKNTRKTNPETAKTIHKDTAKTKTRKKETFWVCNTNSYI